MNECHFDISFLVFDDKELEGDWESAVDKLIKERKKAVKHKKKKKKYFFRAPSH